MMIGEEDYSSMFFAYWQSGEYHDQLYFPVATYAIYLILLMTLTIIVMNLLVRSTEVFISFLRRALRFAIIFNVGNVPNEYFSQ